MSNTEIPAAEVDLSTKRQRLYHVTWLNRYRLDMQLRPLLRELEESTADGRMAVLFKATFRGAVTLINHYLHFDIREHPSAILLVLLKVIDDRTLDSIWADYAPLIKWVNKDREEDGEVPTTHNNKLKDIQPDTATGLSNASRGHARVRKDNILPHSSDESDREEADSNTGQQTR